MVGKRYKSGTGRFACSKKVVGNIASRRWLSAAEDTATLVLRTNHRGGHVGRAQVRQPVIMVGATASGPSCKKIGRRDLSRGERKARRTYAWFRLAGYVRRRCRCNLQSLGWCDQVHSTSSCTTGERAVSPLMLIRDKSLYYIYTYYVYIYLKVHAWPGSFKNWCS